jgi:hypothetical protein
VPFNEIERGSSDHVFEPPSRYRSIQVEDAVVAIRDADDIGDVFEHHPLAE